MRLKYYLRGLGIGILITTVILMITSVGKTKPMTDAEIISRAEELGMVMGREGGLNNIGNSGNEDGADGTQPEGVQNEGEDANNPAGGNNDGDPGVSGSGDTHGDGTEPQGQAEPDSVTEPEDPLANVGNGANGAEGNTEPGELTGQDITPGAENEVKVITIGEGEYSNAVSQKLMEAGLVADAEEFNNYLIEHNLDTKLARGAHTIPVGASFEDIAALLCREAT